MCCSELIKVGEWWKDIRLGDRSVTFKSEEDALAFLALGKPNVVPELQIMYEVVKTRREQTNAK